MANKKTAFNKNERVILQVLYKERRSMTINELVEKTGMSWVTIKKYLQLLKKRNYVIEKVGNKSSILENKRAVWEINYDEL